MHRHPFDALSFLAGAFYLGLGLLLLTGGAGSLSMEWAGPILAVGIGLVIVFAARPRRSSEEEEDSVP
jgi:hypothetical protein